MKDELTGAIKYDVFKRANILSEWKAYFVLRARRKMFRIFMENINPEKNDNILDAGVVPVKGLSGVKTVTNNFFEYFYPYTNRITATSIEDASALEDTFKGLTFVRTEPYSTPFADKEFDVVYCNAVVEHTGSREQQQAFVREYCRVGKKFFFTTPNRWFPIEPHSVLPLVHWLPPKFFRKILKLIGMNGIADESMLNLLTEKEFKALFPKNVELNVVRIKTMGWTSNIVIYGVWPEHE